MTDDKFLTDEEFNKYYDEIAANDALTPEQMDALTALRNDLYERMTAMKDNESYREKYDELADRYKRRWREDGDSERESRKERKEEREKKLDDEDAHIDNLWEKREGRED